MAIQHCSSSETMQYIVLTYYTYLTCNKSVVGIGLIFVVVVRLNSDWSNDGGLRLTRITYQKTLNQMSIIKDLDGHLVWLAHERSVPVQFPLENWKDLIRDSQVQVHKNMDKS